MKKIFTLIAAALTTMGAYAQGTYAVGEGTPADNEVVTSVPNITMTYGTGFKESSAQSALADLGFSYCTNGNDNPKVEDGIPTSGVFYKFEPAKNGTITTGVVLNADKAFYVTNGAADTEFTITKSDGTAVTLTDRKSSEKLTGGIVKFDVVANNTYYVYCTGSKLGFYGFIYEATEGGGSTSNANHAVWEASSLPQSFEAGIEAGFGNVWDTYLATPADYTLCETDGFRAYFELPTLLGPGNGNYSGKGYGMKPLMGMNNSSRDGIDPLFFFEGLENNDYVRTNSDATHGVDYTDAIVTLKVAAEDEGGKYGMVTLTYNRGGNLSAMYVVDQTAKNGDGMMVLQSRTRCPDDNIQSHVAKFGVEPGHTYYILASEKQSVELYKLEYDAVVADDYETLNTKENLPVYWDAASLPADFNAGIEAGFGNVWDTYLATPADYTLCEGEGFRAYFELPTLLGPGNGNYSGKAYGMKPLMGMNNSSRDGIDPLFFFEGLENNDYVRTNSDATHGVDYTDAIVTMKVATEDEGGKYGKVSLNYNRGGNLSAMYVVDATAKNGDGMMVLQSRTRCPDDAIKTHTAQFGVEPGHTYYVIASEKQSVELYSLGFCPVTAENYYVGDTATGIENVVVNKKSPNSNVMYNLAGQRISAPVSGQIYILNGKKYIAK